MCQWWQNRVYLSYKENMMFKIGDKCNWKFQSERLIYLGYNWSGNGHWHQFALIDQPDEVWCEVLTEDLELLELSEKPETGIKTREVSTSGFAKIALKEVLETYGYDGSVPEWFDYTNERKVTQYKKQNFPNRGTHKKNSRKGK